MNRGKNYNDFRVQYTVMTAHTLNNANLEEKKFSSKKKKKKKKKLIKYFFCFEYRCLRMCAALVLLAVWCVQINQREKAGYIKVVSRSGLCFSMVFVA